MIVAGKYAQNNLSGEFMRYVRCMFCDERRKSGDFLCAACRTLYGPYAAEEWFSELVQMEKRQRRITKLESTNFEVDYLPKEPERYWGSSRPRGRPRTTDIIESFIKSVYSANHSVRSLTKLCNATGLIVSRESVRMIINKLKLTKN